MHDFLACLTVEVNHAVAQHDAIEWPTYRVRRVHEVVLTELHKCAHFRTDAPLRFGRFRRRREPTLAPFGRETCELTLGKYSSASSSKRLAREVAAYDLHVPTLLWW